MFPIGRLELYTINHGLFSCSPGDTESKHIWVHIGETFSEVLFLVFKPFTMRKSGVARWNPVHVTPMPSCVFIPCFKSEAPWVSLNKVTLMASF